MIWNLDGIRLRLQTVCSAASGEFASRQPKSPQAICFVEDDGGVDGTRTRGLRRDRQEAMTAHHSRPRKNGVGCPADRPVEANRGRLVRNGLQVLAKKLAVVLAARNVGPHTSTARMPGSPDKVRPRWSRTELRRLAARPEQARRHQL
jgi:hypothetical protein